MKQMLIILSSLLFLLMGFSFLVGMLNTPKSKRYKQMMTLTGIGFVLFISSVFAGQINFTSKPKVDEDVSQQIEEPQSTPVEIIIERPKVEVPVTETPVEAPKVDKEAETQKNKEAEENKVKAEAKAKEEQAKIEAEAKVKEEQAKIDAEANKHSDPNASGEPSKGDKMPSEEETVTPPVEAYPRPETP